MRRKLSLIVGLAVLGICVVAGSAVAGGNGSVVGVGEGGVQINIPDGGNLDDVQVLPQCSNTADDDGDGVTDLADPDCSGALDATESGSSGVPAPPSTTPEPPTGGGGGGGGGGSGGGEPEGTEAPVPEPGGAVGPTGDEGRGIGEADEESDISKPGENRDDEEDSDDGGTRAPMDPEADYNPDGSPTDTNPSVTIADFGAAPIGVPNFVIDQFTIPPFLLPIYQACGTQYGIPWQVLASINRIETAFGTNLNVSSAGALGWMQFMPATWEMYGVDANEDGRKDPYNPVDAICAAARYLRAAGGADDLRTAIFAYNHADWYVDEVLLYANQYGKLPETLISSLTGLTEGAHFPVAANARYADDISERRALERSKPGKRALGNAAEVITSSPTRRGINIYAREGAPVVAVNDGVVVDIGESKKLGKYLVLQDTYGNRFTYAELGEVSEAYPVPKEDKLTAKDFELVTPKDDEAPDEPASAGRQLDDERGATASPDAGPGHDEPVEEEARDARDGSAAADSGPTNTEDARERLFALPERKANRERAGLTGQLDSLLAEGMPGYEQFKGYLANVMRFNPKKMELRPLRKGSEVAAGTVLGRIGESGEVAPHVHFQIKPAGRGAPKIDPKPILDGWKLLEATAIYRAAGKSPFADGAANASQVLLMSKTQLIQRVLNDPSIEIYACGREDIQSGQIDRRILAMLEYLVARGFDLTITSLKCGHSIYTTSGNVSHHSTGDAVDIAQINGMPVLGHQGPGSVSEALVRDLIALQGTMKPAQIISLMDYFGADNTFAMGDHADHVHVGYTPISGPGSGSISRQFSTMLKPEQWERLIDRIAEIDNPTVPTEPSDASLPSGKGKGSRDRASAAHLSE
jgi:murein DD-endopeptidase MepM/ murein hydrolase activator NlpD